MIPIHLFQIRVRPEHGAPKIRWLAQDIVVGGETYIWVDGLADLDPILMLPNELSECKPVGTYQDYFSSHMPLFLKLILARPNLANKPGLMARAIEHLAQFPQQDPNEVCGVVFDAASRFRILDKADRKRFVDAVVVR